MPVAHLEVFAEHVAVGLHDTSLDLSDNAERVDRSADVMRADDRVDHDVAGLDVDAELDDLGDVAVGEVRHARTVDGAQRLGRRWCVAEPTDRRPGTIPPRLVGLFGRPEDRVTRHPRETACAGRAGIAR